MKRDAEEILKHSQLSVTESRKKILHLFQASPGALAHADIENHTSDQYDRVTIYRTLQTFLEKGIIHAIPTADNSVRYALCKDDCRRGKSRFEPLCSFAVLDGRLCNREVGPMQNAYGLNPSAFRSEPALARQP